MANLTSSHLAYGNVIDHNHLLVIYNILTNSQQFDNINITGTSSYSINALSSLVSLSSSVSNLATFSSLTDLTKTESGNGINIITQVSTRKFVGTGLLNSGGVTIQDFRYLLNTKTLGVDCWITVSEINNSFATNGISISLVSPGDLEFSDNGVGSNAQFTYIGEVTQ